MVSATPLFERKWADFVRPFGKHGGRERVCEKESVSLPPLSKLSQKKEIESFQCPGSLARLVSLVYLTVSGRARSLDVSHERPREVVLGAGDFQVYA